MALFDRIRSSEPATKLIHSLGLNLYYEGNPDYKRCLEHFKTYTKADVVLLGDSHFRKPDWEWTHQGIGGDTSLGALRRIDQVIRIKPKCCFVEIGINDLVYHVSPHRVIRNIREICIVLLRAGIKVYLFSIFKVGSDYPNAQAVNENVEWTNGQIRQINGISFIPIEPMPEDYSADHIHLSEIGNEKIKMIIRKVLRGNGEK